MQVGDEITWREMVRTTNFNAKRVRFFTGIIVGERTGRRGRQFEVAVRFLSGNLPAHPKHFMWVPVSDLLMNRMIDHRHVNKVSPLVLIQRQARQQARKEYQSELDIILTNIATRKRAA